MLCRSSSSRRDGAATEWLADALAALAQIQPAPTTLSRLSVYEDSVHFSFPDPDVLAALRPQGQLNASATLTGPPLWGPEGGAVARRLAKVLVREGLKARLVRRTLSVLVLVPASVAMGIVALVGSEGLSGLAVFAAIAGPLIALVAAFLTGVSLTRKGDAERRRWEDYADWLSSNSQLHRVGAPGVATWGDVLPPCRSAGSGADRRDSTVAEARHLRFAARPVRILTIRDSSNPCCASMTSHSPTSGSSSCPSRPGGFALP